MQKRTDEQIIEALALAGVPKLYRRKDVGLKASCGVIGNSLSELLKAGGHRGLLEGGVIEIRGTSVETTKAFYLLVRELVVRNMPASVLFAEDLRPSRITDDIYTQLLEYKILAVEGLTPHKCNPFGAEAQTVEYRLRRWLDQGLGLIILTDGQISDCGVWSKRFCDLLEERKISLF